MTTTKTISFGYKSDVGKRRDVNEDSCAVLDRAMLNGKLEGLLIVADGLGGRRAGEVASSLLVETVSAGVLEVTSGVSGSLSSRDVEQLLRDTIVRANGTIMTQGRFHKREETRGMATTCVTAIVHDSSVSIANVGDSRIYLLRSGELHQLTEDHSEVFREFVKGNITQDEARNHRFRNQITRAVGLEPNVKPDISTLPLEEGDTLLLCSDGLTTEVPDEILESVLAAAPGAQDACDRLISLALRSGGRDNITVVVMRYGEFTPAGSFDVEFDLLDEPDTDPTQDWRTNSDVIDDMSWERDDESSASFPALEPAAIPTARPRRSGGVIGFVQEWALAFIGVLLLGLLVEGAMLFNLYHNGVKPPPPAAPRGPVYTLGSISYAPPVQVLDAAVLPDVLQITSKGNPVVATPDGTVQTYLINEKRLLPPQGLIPPVPPTSTSAQIKKAPHGKSHADVFIDAYDNLFCINPNSKCIETYTSTGTRTNEDLGKGLLKAPTKLIVAPNGAIFVIDDNHLKVLNVKAAPTTSAHPKDADY